MGRKQDGSSFQGVLLIVKFVVKGSGYNNNNDDDDSNEQLIMIYI